jgi:hypothetical protein
VVERVDLAAERHAERQRWRNGGEWDASAAFVAVGELAGRALVCAPLWAASGPLVRRLRMFV